LPVRGRQIVRYGGRRNQTDGKAGTLLVTLARRGAVESGRGREAGTPKPLFSRYLEAGPLAITRLVSAVIAAAAKRTLNRRGRIKWEVETAPSQAQG